MVRTPGEIFTYMQSNKIGEKVALFWIAWAYVAEKALNYKLADQIFQKGMLTCMPIVTINGPLETSQVPFVYDHSHFTVCWSYCLCHEFA